VDESVLRLAQLVKVDAYRRRGVKGQSEHVHAYVRKDLDAAGFGSAKTKKGAFVSEVGTQDRTPKPAAPATTYLGVDDFRTVAAAAQISDLTDGERESVAKYMFGFDGVINKYRRRGVLPDVDAQRDYSEDEGVSRTENARDQVLLVDRDLTNIFERMPRTPHPVELWRGLKSPRDWKVGDTITEPGYASASLDPKVPKKFGSGAIMRIRVPKGAKIMDEYGNGDLFNERRIGIGIEEKAMLLPPGTRMKVSAVNGNEITLDVEPNLPTVPAPPISDAERRALYTRTLGIEPKTEAEVDGWWANPYGRDLSKPTTVAAHPNFAMYEDEAAAYRKAHPRQYPPLVPPKDPKLRMAVVKVLTGQTPVPDVTDEQKTIAFKTWTLIDEDRAAGKTFSFQRIQDRIEQAQNAWAERHSEPSKATVDAWFDKISKRKAPARSQLLRMSR
jgi:hypothetical protein